MNDGQERDSNPRETEVPAGFQNRCLKPLGHPTLRAADRQTVDRPEGAPGADSGPWTVKKGPEGGPGWARDPILWPDGRGGYTDQPPESATILRGDDRTIPDPIVWPEELVQAIRDMRDDDYDLDIAEATPTPQNPSAPSPLWLVAASFLAVLLAGAIGLLWAFGVIG